MLIYAHCQNIIQIDAVCSFLSFIWKVYFGLDGSIQCLFRICIFNLSRSLRFACRLHTVPGLQRAGIELCKLGMLLNNLADASFRAPSNLSPTCGSSSSYSSPSACAWQQCTRLPDKSVMNTTMTTMNIIIIIKMVITTPRRLHRLHTTRPQPRLITRLLQLQPTIVQRTHHLLPSP
jgi:hypothetical protein